MQSLWQKIKTNIVKIAFLCVIVGFAAVAQAQPVSETTPDESGQAVAGSVIEVPLVPLSFADIAEMVSPAVVNIKTMQSAQNNSLFGAMPEFDDPNNPFYDLFERFFGGAVPDSEPTPSMGSGFIWDTDGYAITNYHVVEDAEEIKVKVGEAEYDATLVGSDSNTDLALLKIDVPKDVKLQAVTLGDSDAMRTGEWVVAIGSPFGLEKTVTVGIISAKGRVIGFGPYEDFIQTDASINPGNSGGPLINLKGEVIGINTAIIASAQGLGFAIPINMARKIIVQLKENGEVTRGWLGVLIQDVTPEMAEYYGNKELKGVLLSEVYTGDPAAEAGLKAGDIVLELNGVKIDEARKLTAQVANIPVGDSAEIKILRDGKEITFKVKIAKREEGRLADLSINPKTPPATKEDGLGLGLSNLDAALAKKYSIEEKTGVVVTAVKSKSAAAKAGLLPGDMVKEIDRQKVNTVDDYKKVVNNIKKDENLKFLIWRVNEGFRVIEVKP